MEALPAAWRYARREDGTEQATWVGRSSPGLATHFHDEHQVTVVLVGLRRFATPAGPVAAAAGEVVVLPAGLPHRALGLDGRASSSLNLYVRSEQATRAPRSAALLLPAPRGLRGDHAPDGHDLRDWLDRLLRRAAPAGAEPCEAERLVASVAGVDATVHAVAAAWGLSREGFTRRFRRAVGMAPAAYKAIARLNAARELLAAGTPPAAAAADAGFADQSHLGRGFRAAFGVTPAAYRAVVAR